MGGSWCGAGCPKALALANRRIEHDGKKGRVELLIGIAVHHAGRGHHGRAPPLGFITIISPAVSSSGSSNRPARRSP